MHDWIMNLTSEELDELLGGLYFLDKEGKDTELSAKMATDIEKAIEMQRRKKAIAPPFDTTLLGQRPPTHLTFTQRKEVQEMIESYARRVEERRAEAVKRVRKRLDELRATRDSMKE